ncbi:MAG: hypothetical protein ACYTCU_05540, partial [Planctomycetota bacterium]
MLRTGPISSSVLVPRCSSTVARPAAGGRQPGAHEAHARHDVLGAPRAAPGAVEQRRVADRLAIEVHQAQRGDHQPVALHQLARGRVADELPREAFLQLPEPRFLHEASQVVGQQRAALQGRDVREPRALGQPMRVLLHPGRGALPRPADARLGLRQRVALRRHDQRPVEADLRRAARRHLLR